MQAWATIALPSFQIKLRAPDQSGRGSSYFQRSSAGWTKGAWGVRRNVVGRKLTRVSRSAGSLEDSTGIAGTPVALRLFPFLMIFLFGVQVPNIDRTA